MNANENPICKGDVYLWADDRMKEAHAALTGSKGPFLELNARNTIFDYWYWAHMPKHEGTIDLELDARGYYFINNTYGIGEGSMVTGNGCIGIFIPNGVDRKTVADDMRCHFNGEVTLVKSQPVHKPDGNTSWLGMLRWRLKLPKSQFLSELVSQCAEEFAMKQPKDNLERLKIYQEVCRKMSVAARV